MKKKFGFLKKIIYISQIYEEPDGFVKIYIPRTNLDHTGQYEVIASNCAGTAKCIGFLSIEQRLPTPEPKEPPGFTKLLEDVTVESGNSISLEAEVTGKPKPLVSYCLGSSNKGILSCAIGVSEVDLSGSLGKEIESEMKKNIILLDSDSTNSDENERAISSKPSSKCKYPGSEELTLGDTGLYISSISQHISNEDVNEVNETNLGARNNFRDIKILDHDVYKRYLDQSLKDEFILDYDQELSDSSFERLEKERENSPNNCNVTSSMSSVVPSRIIDNKKLEELWTIVQEQHKLLNASDRKQTNARDSGYYSDRYGTTCANNMNEVQYKNSSKSLKLSDSKTMESGRKVLLTLETTALSQDFVSEIEKSKCLPVPKFFDDKNKGSKIVKSGKSSHTTAETGYYYTEFLEYNHLENCSLNSKYLVDENSSIDSRGKNKPKKVKRSETIDLLHLLFDEKYEDAYISKVYLDTEPLKSELSLVPDISSKDFQIKNYYHKYFSYPRTRGKFKALEGRSCRSMTQLEVINEETISDKEESYEDKENVFSPLNSVSKSGESSYMINISPGNGNGFFNLKSRASCKKENLTDGSSKIVNQIFDSDSKTEMACLRKETQNSSIQLQHLKKFTERLKSPSRLSSNTTFHSTVNSLSEFQPLHSCLRLRPTKYVIPFQTLTNSNRSSEVKCYKESSPNIILSDGIYFFVTKILNKITLTQMKKNIVEKLSTTFKSSNRVLHTYILSFGGLNDPINTNINPLSITTDTLSNCIHHFIMKTCELATYSQSVIHTGQYSDPTVPYFVQAGYFLIYVLCYKDSEHGRT